MPRFSLGRLFVATALAAAGFGLVRDVWSWPWPMLPIIVASCFFGVAVWILTKRPIFGGCVALLALVVITFCNIRAME